LKYADLLLDAVKKFRIDMEINWNDELCELIADDMVSLGCHDWEKMLNKIIWCLETYWEE